MKRTFASICLVLMAAVASTGMDAQAVGQRVVAGEKGASLFDVLLEQTGNSNGGLAVDELDQVLSCQRDGGEALCEATPFGPYSSPTLTVTVKQPMKVLSAVVDALGDDSLASGFSGVFRCRKSGAAATCWVSHLASRQ